MSSLKQSNKSHKTGRHRSKGMINAQDGGRIETSSQRHKRQITESRMSRMNLAKQLRSAKRLEVIKKKRSSKATPHLIVIVGLCDAATDSKMVSKLLTPDFASEGQTSPNRVTFTSPMLKREVTLVAASGTDIFDVMTLARVADTVLFAVSATEPISDFGKLCNTVVKTIGASNIAHLLVGLDVVPTKRRGDVKKDIGKLLANEHPETKLYTALSATDSPKIVWGVANQKGKPVKWRDNHPYMLAESVEHVPRGDGTKGTLVVKGYLRGHALNVNDLVHLPGHGACQLTKITKADLEQTREGDMEMTEGNADIVAQPSMEKLQSLDSEVPIDPMAGEQTWPSEEEIIDSQSHTKTMDQTDAPPPKHLTKVKVPVGTSSYQARWIVDAFGGEGQEGENDDEEEDEMDADAVMQEDDAMDLGGIIKKSVSFSDNDSTSGASGLSAFGGRSSAKDGDDLITLEDASKKKSVKYDLEMDMEEEEKAREELSLARDEREWPDEVDTPTSMDARVRFQKYRGLQSFRHSSWDPREELPIEYARIFQFQHFKQTRKRVLMKAPKPEDEEDWIMSGSAVTLHLADIPTTFAQHLSADVPLTIFGLLEHENKTSLLNFKLTMHSSYTRPIKSKERLEFYTGLRRFSACPTFSQHTVGNKHKFERYFQPGAIAIASVFSPIMYPPGPVVVFRRTETNALTLVATGSLLSVDPDRVVIKRIRLVGHPYKLNKRTAVIRYMFFKPDDIHWFKPVELSTKYGRSGHIKESLGTHGHMKCVFDKPLNAQDTVIMNLYKRVYPKWTYME